MIDGPVIPRLREDENLQEMAQALRSWSEHPDALFAQAWVAAVGYRED